jgi:endogenous inhibitor of DNA gyrase (YacG/DUF329 family)
MTDSGKIVPLRPELNRGRPCPMCGKPADPAHRPFCSKRCADLDLGQWLGEGYRIPGEKAPAAPESRPGDEEDLD